VKETTFHFKQFTELLTDTIALKGLKNAKGLQKKQLETLVKLERRFRKELIKTRAGMELFREFIHYICNVRRNILSARPFFRVRQKYFTAKISPALKERSESKLSKFHFNFQFIKFVINARNWSKKHIIYKLYREISNLREQLVIANMPLALSRARMFYSKTPKSHLEHMDFTQISAEGLIKAIDKFVLPFRPQFRAVIIGRITGDFIENYSETLVHFWPSDRRKLYNSNKLVGSLKAQGQTEVDYGVLASQVNEKISGSATADEISNLMAAASTVSSDTPVTIGDEEVAVSQRFSAPIDMQPDVRVENSEAMGAVYTASKKLTVVELKLLRLKGVDL
jgi:DNA-directed RNA polymerase specialized sigma subunit